MSKKTHWLMRPNSKVTACSQSEGRVNRTQSITHVTCAHCRRVYNEMYPQEALEDKFLRVGAEIFVRGQGQDKRLYRIFMPDPQWEQDGQGDVLEAYAEDIVEVLNERWLRD